MSDLEKNSMNKRIFIAIHYMEIGGAEMSLIGLLNAFDTEKYDVDLFVYSHQGDYMQLIPDKIHLLPEIKKYSMTEKPIKEVLKNGYLDVVLARLWAKWKFKKYTKKNHINESSAASQFAFHYLSGTLPSLSYLGEYDLAISFLIPHNIVLNKVNSKRKVAWIHTDYTKISCDIKMELPIWNGYNFIVSISSDASNGFLKIFPSLKEKVQVIENILSMEFIRSQATNVSEIKDMKKTDDAINLLSVGRLHPQKNFDNVPEICKLIRDKGINVKWYIIGEGILSIKNEIISKIHEYGMEEHVILLGKKLNPYPYMKCCDIYVQPSRYEGKSVTVREAQILCKPVIITDYPTSKSQLKDGFDGIIIPLENKSAADGIISLINNKQLQDKLIKNMSLTDYGNEMEISKIYQLIE